MTPLPTILDRYATHIDATSGPTIRVRRSMGTKVWRMQPDTFTKFIRSESVEMVRIDADLNVVVQERAA